MKIRTVEDARAWRNQRISEQEDINDKFSRLREALNGITGIPTLSKLTAFLNTIKTILGEVK